MKVILELIKKNLLRIHKTTENILQLGNKIKTYVQYSAMKLNCQFII